MKNKVTRNKPQPGSEEINARKDFGSVLKQHQAGNTSSGSVSKGVFKFGWMHGVALGIAAIAVGAVLYFSGVFNSKEGMVNPTEEKLISDDHTFKPAENKDMIQKAFIAPPIAGLDIAYTSYKVKANKENTLTHTTGSKIKIPKNAFVDKEGKTVEGEVDIRYREFHDPVDFFVSGIPMTYDSAGTQYQFESAGMLEIYAFKNGEVVKMSPDKLIEVELTSNDKSAKYNLYQLDTLEKNWSYKGKDKVKEMGRVGELRDTGSYFDLEAQVDKAIASDAKINTTKVKIEDVRADIKKITEAKPLEPLKADKKKYQFNIDVDPREFPDLALYKGALFEVGSENKDFSDKYYNVIWDNAVLSENKKGVSYFITLSKGKETHKWSVYPVFEGKNYEQAKQDYQKKFSQYQVKLEERKAEEKRLQEEAQARMEQIKQEQAALMKKWQEEEEKRMASMNTEQKVFRTFTINGFGVWNCDSPNMLPRGNAVAASFRDKEGNPITFNQVYLVEKSRNALFTYYSQKFGNLTYNPNSKNMMWGMTTDGRLAVFTYEQFAGVPKKTGPYIFVMSAEQKTFARVDDIKSYLNI